MQADPASPEFLLTTTPAPPSSVRAWRLHLRHMNALPREPVDLWLVGDSLIEECPSEFWAPWSTFNTGIGGDKTQHVLWRLGRLTPGQIAARRVLLMIGSNNIGQGDPSGSVYEGTKRIVDRLAELCPTAELRLIEPPPFRPGFEGCVAERERLGALLRAGLPAHARNIDAAMTDGFSQSSANYRDDGIHFSPVGYRTLIAAVMGFFRV